MYKTTQPSNPVSDIIRPNSLASISIDSNKGGRSTDDLLGPIGSDKGVRSTDDLLGTEETDVGGIPSPLSPISLTSPPVISLTSPPSVEKHDFDFAGKDMFTVIHEADLLTFSATPPLDLCWDLLCDVDTFQV